MNSLSYVIFSIYMPMGYIRMSVLRDENNKPYDYRITDANQISAHFFGKPLEQYVGVLASVCFPIIQRKWISSLKCLMVSLIKKRMSIFLKRDCTLTGLCIHRRKMRW